MKTYNAMHPKAVAHLPVGREWSYEVKWDGYRTLAVKDGRTVRLLSRTQTDMTRHFPRIAGEVAQLRPSQLVLDGELVALDAEGRPSFQGLQEWYRGIRDGPPLALAYYVFDLLSVDGQSWMTKPLNERRRRLATIVRGETLLLSRPLPGRPAAIERHIRAIGLEGVVAKRRGSPYRAGERSNDWQKVRFSPRQEFVVGGYRADAVLVGFYEDGALRYAGSVSAGFNKRTRLGLMDRFLNSAVCPFVDLPHYLPYRDRHPWDMRLTTADMASCRWVRPSEVIEVAFLGWGRHGLLREASYLGFAMIRWRMRYGENE